MSNSYSLQSLKCVALLAAFVALPTSAEGATLAELFAGGSITAGNARFSHWELISLDTTATQSPLLSQIFITPLTNIVDKPGLQYSTNGQLATTGINALDFLFRYRVSTLPSGKAFLGQSQDLTGVAFGGPGGIAYVSQENATLGGTDLGATLIISDNGAEFEQNTDSVSFDRQFSVGVTTNIFVTGTASNDTVSLTSFTQRFSQTGPVTPAGDFDSDGDADGHDFLVWQRGGSPNPLSTSDLNAWRNTYGSVTALGAVITAVPEPSTFVLLLAACCLAVNRSKS